MKYPTLFLACLLTMALSTIAHAEIYETKDAEGNPVFTDTPTAAAEKVVLPTENIADAVKVPPAPPAGPGAKEHSNVSVIPDSRNEQMDQVLDADRPREVLNAEERHEVGDVVTPEELKRRQEAKDGEFVNKDGNAERVEHRGHVGGNR
ncbi:MAG: DUF4124 domain-containing protein [Halioglobus sp.]